MPLLATDFGASAAIGLMVLSAWAVVLLVVICGVWYAGRLLRSESPGNRKTGNLVILLCILLPILCCVAPPISTCVIYGNFPIRSNADAQVHEGMTMDEVRALLGTPHELFEHDDGQKWYYWNDSFSITYVCIHFGPDGRVSWKHIN